MTYAHQGCPEIGLHLWYNTTIEQINLTCINFVFTKTKTFVLKANNPKYLNLLACRVKYKALE